jgi:hypothetical protein
MLKAGEFNKRITLYAPAQTVDDGMGGRKPDGPEAATETWASVTQRAEKTTFPDGKFVFRTRYNIVIRQVNVPDAAPYYRLVYDGVELGISSLIEDRQKNETAFICYGNQ